MSNSDTIHYLIKRGLLNLFPFTHLCFARDIFERINNEIVLGAIFPDIAIAGFLNHSDTHQGSRALHSYCKRLNVFQDFSRGVITHSTDLKGLDYYCDEKYKDYEKGFAFELARPLIDKVVNCGFPREMDWWKAHNFVEMASELCIYKDRPEFHGLLEKALSDDDTIMALSQVLAPFFEISIAKMAMSFPIYGEYVFMKEITPLEMARKYHKQTLKKHGINLNLHAAAEIIEETMEIVTPYLPKFLQTCEHSVRNVIENLD